MVPLLHPGRNGTNEKFYGSVLVPFRKEITVPKVDQEMELVKKRNLINNAS